MNNDFSLRADPFMNQWWGLSLMIKVTQRGKHLVYYFLCFWLYWGECLLFWRKITHFTGSPHESPWFAWHSDQKQSSWRLQAPCTFWFSFKLEDRLAKKRSFSFTSLLKPWEDSLVVVPKLPFEWSWSGLQEVKGGPSTACEWDKRSVSHGSVTIFQVNEVAIGLN